MKTHTYMDRTKWPVGAWDSEPDHAEWRDEKTGLPCLAHRNGMGAWCGYVGVAPGHPWHGVDYGCCPQGCDESYCGHSPASVADAHGGLTYADRCQDGPAGEVICHVPLPGEPDDVWWFGFDTAHSGDQVPGLPTYSHVYPDVPDTYRTLAYVREECANLARQLAEAATIDVYAHALRVEHLPVIDGTVAELVAVARAGEEIHVRWVPRGADLHSAVRAVTYGLDDLVPCLRRAEVPT